MRRKRSAITAWTVLMTVIMAGCGRNSKTEGQKAENGTVDMKVWASQEDVGITQEMCDRFARLHPEYQFSFTVLPVGVDESGDALTADPDAAADVFLIPSGSLSILNDAGLLYPITVELSETKELYAAEVVEACSRDGELYGIPIAPNSWFLYYNKSMYTEEEVQVLDIMMEKELGEDVANFSCSVSDSWYLEAFFYAAGCTLYGEDGADPSDCTWNSKDGYKAGEYLLNLVNSPKYVEDIDGIAGSKMKEGKLGALCSGTWAAEGLKEALGENYAAGTLPAIIIDGKECRLRNFSDYKCYAVNAGTEYPLLAQQLAEYLGNEENQLFRYLTNATTPTCLSLKDNEALIEDEASQALLSQMEYSIPQPSIQQMDEYWTPAKALGTGIVNGDITIENLQEKLDIAVEGIVSK